MKSLLEKTFSFLERAEDAIGNATDTDFLLHSSLSDKQNSGLPHRATAIRIEGVHNPTLEIWAECVEKLWQVAMMLPGRTLTWDALSARMVLWRALAGEEASLTTEWVRRETVRMLQS
jgi:nucleolar pre-ribosomal-associated protein 1